jgi:hypothetical protein
MHCVIAFDTACLIVHDVDMHNELSQYRHIHTVHQCQRCHTLILSFVQKTICTFALVHKNRYFSGVTCFTVTL